VNSNAPYLDVSVVDAIVKEIKKDACEHRRCDYCGMCLAFPDAVIEHAYRHARIDPSAGVKRFPGQKSFRRGAWKVVVNVNNRDLPDGMRLFIRANQKAPTGFVGINSSEVHYIADDLPIERAGI
jgi:hypothetical protein